MRGIHCLVVVAALAGCGDDPTTTITCGAGTEGTLTAATPVTVGDSGADLRGASIAAQAQTTLPSAAVTIACSPDIAPPGYIALGPAVTFGADGTWSDRPFLLTLPYKRARLPRDAERRHVRVVARRAGQTESFFPPVANRRIEDDDAYASRATFKAGELTTYQLVADENAGKPQTRQYGWNAIIGISMGGNAAMSIGLRHPERFDIVADMVGEPGPSMVYSLSMVRDYLFGGFCTAADQAAGRGNIGQLCPKVSTKQNDQFEITADFEHMIYQEGEGVGLTLTRSLYMKASRDLGRALSNPALYNPTNPYLPPGVPPSFLLLSAAERCTQPTVLANFYDREFNPSGTEPVITFCDGGDGPALGNAVFDPNVAQDDPAELLLAVDLNGNNIRDAGEPVITNAYEPFADDGADAIPSALEPGYDAATNPDPNGDDYHSLRNPRGTEGNGVFDANEIYEDVGLDGVASTCQAPATGCFDHGEGNGVWDLSPNVARWYEGDVITRLSALTDEQRDHVSLWFDAGIRDFLNASVSANAGVGQTLAKWGLPFGVYDNFNILDGGASEQAFDFLDIPWPDFPKHGYLRYGNPDATTQEANNGDGRHVGTANQIIYRAQTAFGWINQRWPDGDKDDTYDGGQIIKDLTHTSPTTGRVSPFSMFLPPGYNKPENASKRYPVVYFLHGYGQEPQDLADLSAVFALNMIATNPIESRFQKFIIVYVDGRCRPNIDGVPVDPTGDLCERGTFYMDAPLGGPAQMETNLLDLMDHIDATYRTKAASAATVVD